MEEGLWFDLPKLLLQLGEDMGREGLLGTPERVEQAWLEFLSGYTLDPKKLLERTFANEGGGPQLCQDIEFTSMCEHHLLPFIGVCHIAYEPDAVVVGLSKLTRLVDCFARRLQIQERMTHQIAEAIWQVLEPKGVLVIAEAKHLCCHGRGIRRSKMKFVTSMHYGEVDQRIYSLFQKGEVCSS